MPQPRAAGYRLVKGELKNQEWVSPTMNTTADGSLLSKRLRYGESGTRRCTQKNCSKRSSLEQMWTPVKLNDREDLLFMGLAWFRGVRCAVIPSSSTAVRGRWIRIVHRALR